MYSSVKDTRPRQDSGAANIKQLDVSRLVNNSPKSPEPSQMAARFQGSERERGRAGGLEPAQWS